MTILGIDEVGRGPWAGPLVIGAVILPDPAPEWVAELSDSKKLSLKKRERLNEIILKESPAFGLGWVTSQELDEIGLSAALKLATRRAVEQVQQKHVPFQQIIIDGTQNFLQGTKLENYVSVLPKADFLIKEVSAASIIAKVARDHYMYELAQKYPAYGFEKHVGYGTATHQKALAQYGPCPEHRKSFKPVANLAPAKPTTKNIGDAGEQLVEHYLINHGHQIIARNFKTKTCEIDIVSEKDGSLYFTEVKTRKNSDFGGGITAIDRRKLSHMQHAAQVFLAAQKTYQKFAPKLAVAEVIGDQLKTWFPLEDNI